MSKKIMGMGLLAVMMASAPLANAQGYQGGYQGGYQQPQQQQPYQGGYQQPQPQPQYNSAYAQQNGQSSQWAEQCQGERTGQVLGGLAGALLGSQIAGKKNKTGQIVGALAGGAGGAFLGGKITCHLANEEDHKFMSAATERTVQTGQYSTWSNPKNGARGRAEVIQTDRRPTRRQISAQANSVDPMVTLEWSDSANVLTTNAKVLRSPSAKAPVNGELQAGSGVQLLGKVSGSPYGLVALGGVAIGYVPMKALRPGTGQDLGVPGGGVQTLEVQTVISCRIVRQTATNSQGQTSSNDIRACQGEDGRWAMDNGQF